MTEETLAVSDISCSGFLPRNGRATIAQTVSGLGALYNMSPELAAALAAVAILISGDIPSGQWSIGAGFPSSLPLVLSNPKGIVGTHDKYEGDASVTRGDAYLNGGNVGVFKWEKWNNLWSMGEDGFTLDKFANQSSYNTEVSQSTNPYYFSGPFSGIVAPAAHNFVVNFMSNHSAEVPGGTLTREVLQSFWAVTGTGAGASGSNPGDFVQHPGQVRPSFLFDAFQSNVVNRNAFRSTGSADHLRISTTLPTFSSTCLPVRPFTQKL